MWKLNLTDEELRKIKNFGFGRKNKKQYFNANLKDRIKINDKVIISNPLLEIEDDSKIVINNMETGFYRVAFSYDDEWKIMAKRIAILFDKYSSKDKNDSDEEFYLNCALYSGFNKVKYDLNEYDLELIKLEKEITTNNYLIGIFDYNFFEMQDKYKKTNYKDWEQKYYNFIPKIDKNNKYYQTYYRDKETPLFFMCNVDRNNEEFTINILKRKEDNKIVGIEINVLPKKFRIKSMSSKEYNDYFGKMIKVKQQIEKKRIEEYKIKNKIKSENFQKNHINKFKLENQKISFDLKKYLKENLKKTEYNLKTKNYLISYDNLKKRYIFGDTFIVKVFGGVYLSPIISNNKTEEEIIKSVTKTLNRKEITEEEFEKTLKELEWL